MIKKAKDMRRTADDNLRGGKGTIGMVHFLEGAESRGMGRLFAIATIPPGASIGEHTHDGEYEIYHVLKGTATVTDNGVEAPLETGDCMVCYHGNRHSIENKTDENCEVLFTVLFGKE